MIAFALFCRCQAVFAHASSMRRKCLPAQPHPVQRASHVTFTNFCEEIEASLAFNRAKPNSERAPKVGLLLSKSDDAHLGYEAGHVDIIESALRVRNDVIRFAWPPVLDRNFFATLADLDWIVTDVGDDPFCAAIAAYVHGAFIPTMRLKRLPEGDDTDPPRPSSEPCLELSRSDTVRTSCAGARPRNCKPSWSRDSRG